MIYPSEVLPKFGGKTIGGCTVLDGIDYQFVSIWDDKDQIDQFREAYGHRISKSGTAMINGILTFYFSLYS